MKPWLALIVILAAACACSPLAASPAAIPTAAALPTLSPTITPPPTTAPTLAPAPSPTPPAWSLAQLKNYTYTLADLGAVTLVDGKFTQEVKDPKILSVVRAALGEMLATGDLNGDGLADAAVILTVNTGGSGTFHYLLVLLAQKGQAAALQVGDRIVEKQLTIADGKIVLDMLRQGPRDPLCCPSEHAIVTYRLNGGALEVVSDQVVPAASPNQISLTAPVQNAVVNNPFKIQGKTSQMPFEKNLIYRVFDASGKQILESFITVAGDLGGPGTFSQNIQLPAATRGAVRVDVIDLDAASGQPRGGATVSVVIQ